MFAEKSTFIVVWLFLLVLIPVHVSAQECMDYSDQPLEITSTVQSFDHDPTNVIVQGDVAFVTTGVDLYSFDISDPNNPILMDTLDSYAFGGGAMAIKGSLLATVRSNDVVFVNISDPHNMFEQSVLSGIIDGSDIVANEDYFYLSGSFSGLHVIDTSNPNYPSEVIIIPPVATSLRYITLEDDHIYGVDNQGNVSTYDIGVSQAPLKSSTTTGNNFPALDIAAKNATVYVATSSNQILVYDMSQPSVPQFLSPVLVTGQMNEIQTAGDFLYGAGNFNFKVFSTVDPANPQLTGKLDHDEISYGFDAMANFAFVSATNGKMFTIDISQATVDLPYTVYNTAGQVNQTWFADDVLLIADGSAGLQIHDATNAPAIPFMAEVAFEGAAVGVEVDGNLAFVATGSDGVGIVDITVPYSPQVLSQIPMPGHARRTAVYGSSLLVAGKEAGLLAFDIADPASPYFQSSIDTDGHVMDVAVTGDLALVASTDGYLRIFDLTSLPAPIQLVGSVPMSGSPSNILVSGNLAYVSGGHSASVVDFSNAQYPVVLGSYTSSSSITGLVFEDQLAYLSMAYEGMEIVDFSNPEDIQLLDILPLVANPQDISSHNGLLFISNSDGGLVMTPPQCLSITGVDDPLTGLGIRFHSQVYPNPFNPRTTISFELPTGATVDLSVFDMAGRRVRSLLAGDYLSAGYNQVIWNGMDDVGRGVSSGVYFYQLESQDLKDSKRMVLVR